MQVCCQPGIPDRFFVRGARSGKQFKYFVNKIDITASYVSREINRQPGVVCRTGGPTLLAAALRRPNRGGVKNFCREVQTFNHGNPQRREPQVIPGLIAAAECLTNEPVILKNMTTGGMMRYIGIITPAGIRRPGEVSPESPRVPGQPRSGVEPPQALYPGTC